LEKVPSPDVGTDDEENHDISRDETFSETDNGKNFRRGNENFQLDSVEERFEVVSTKDFPKDHEDSEEGLEVSSTEDFPKDHVDSEEEVISTADFQRDQGDSSEEEVEAEDSKGSPCSLKSSSSIDYTVEYSAGVVDSSNDLRNLDVEDSEKQTDTEETLLDSEIGSEVEDKEKQTPKIQDVNKNKSEEKGGRQNSEDSVEMSTGTGESVEMSQGGSESVAGQQQSLSSEFDSEAIEILSTKSTSDSELEMQCEQSTYQVKKLKNSSLYMDCTTYREMASKMLKEAIVKIPKMDLSQTSKQQDTTDEEKRREEMGTDSGVSTSFDRRSKADEGKENISITPIDDVIKEECSDKNIYIRSRLPDFESDSDLEITEITTSFPLKIFDDAPISLSESSSDELPEVLFLREEKAEPVGSVSYNGLFTIKEEAITPTRTSLRSKAGPMLQKTPVKLAETSSPRKVLRKRLSLKRTPVKKPSDAKKSPPPRRKNPRTPRKKETLKQTSKKTCIDSDVEIVSMSESEEELVQKKLKCVKQEVISGEDSDSGSDNVEIRVREKNSQGPKSDHKDKSASQREGGLKRVYPLQEQFSGESQGIQFLSFIWIWDTLFFCLVCYRYNLLV
jgi:hypothetical protein